MLSETQPSRPTKPLIDVSARVGRDIGRDASIAGRDVIGGDYTQHGASEKVQDYLVDRIRELEAELTLARQQVQHNRAAQRELAILKSDHVQVLARLADAYYAQRRWDEHIQQATALLKFLPNNANVHYNLGNAYLKRRDLIRALANYTRAIGLDPANSMACNNRGITQSKAGNLDRAIADFDRAVSLDPENSAAYYNRGIAYHEKGYLDRAIADLKMAGTLDPSITIPHYLK